MTPYLYPYLIAIERIIEIVALHQYVLLQSFYNNKTHPATGNLQLAFVSSTVWIGAFTLFLSALRHESKVAKTISTQKVL
jgi:hypothetical protein